MKATGVAWMNVIPDNWEVLCGRHLFEIRKRIAGELGYPVISVTQTGLKVKDTDSFEGQISQDYSKYQLLKVGEFAMNSMDLLTGGVGIADVAGVTSPDYRVFAIRDSSRGNSTYMLHVMRMLYQNRGFYAWGQGSSQLGRWRLPRKRFKEFPFPVPPREEQDIIVAYLDRKLAKIDRYIANRRRLIELVIERRCALTDEVIHQQGTSDKKLREVVESTERLIAREDNTSYTPIGMYNRGRGIFHKEMTLGKDLGDSTFYWIQEGDLVLSGQFAWEGAVALAFAEDAGCIASHRYPVFKSKSALVLTEYLYAFFCNSYGHMLLDHHSRGAAGRNRPLNSARLIKEYIPIPSLERQKEIATLIHFEHKLKGMLASEESSIGEYRASLIAQAVTGKIPVNEMRETVESSNAWEE